MKTLFILILIGLAGVGGYYIGNDHGYERAVIDQKAENEPLVDSLVDYSLNAAEAALVGNWRNTEDPRFTREFRGDGSAVDLYDNGDETDRTQLSWNVFNADEPDTTYKGSYKDSATYLHMSNGAEDLFFELNKITSEELEMVFLDGNGVLTFKKVN